MRLLRRILLAAILLLAGTWLAAGAALAWWLPAGWAVTHWPMSVPGLAARSPEGAVLRWTPLDWRDLRVSGQNITPPGSRLGPITALDGELTWHGSLPTRRAVPPDARLEIVGLSVLWGPLRFSGAGELLPDGEGGLRGPVRGRIEGLGGELAALARSGLIQSSGGARGEVTLPLSLLRDGRLMLGPLLLAHWQ